MHRGGGGWGRMRRRRGVVMTNTEIFHIFHIISLFNLLFFIFSIFFHISTYFSSIISKSFYYSTYLSSIFSLSFHYLTYLSSIFFISFHYSNYVSSVLFISFHYSTYFSSVFSISSHYSTWVSSKFFISFHYSRNIRSNVTRRASPETGSHVTGSALGVLSRTSGSYNLIIFYELALSLVFCPFPAILFSWGALSMITQPFFRVFSNTDYVV